VTSARIDPVTLKIGGDSTVPRSPTLSVMRWFLTACAVIVAATACSGSDPTDDPLPLGIIVDAEPTPEAFDASDPEQLSGVSTNPSNLRAGDCFNDYVYLDSAEFLQQITTLVGCDGPHDREAYFLTEYPADDDAPAPPEDTLRRWAEAACLEEFESFVGLEYVLSKLEIGVIVPTFETWNEEDDRNVICFVFPDEADRRLRTSVANSGL